MESTSWNLFLETVQADGSEASLTTICPSPGNDSLWTSNFPASAERDLTTKTVSADSRWIRERENSPTPLQRKRRLGRERDEHMEGVLLSKTPFSIRNGGRDASRILWSTKPRSRKPLSSGYMDNGYEQTSNSTTDDIPTRASNIVDIKNESGWSSIAIRGSPLGSSCATAFPRQYTTPSGSRNSSGSSSGGMLSLSSSSGETSNSIGEASNSRHETHGENDSPEQQVVTVEIIRNSRQDCLPARLICWHKANGIDCRGSQFGQNSEARRLLNDHTQKRKKGDRNHHTLSSPCNRCYRIFDTDEALRAHSRDVVPCPVLQEGERQPANDEISQTGASPNRLEEIRNAMSKYESRQTLPPECQGREKELEEWVTSNTNLYIGQSQTTSKATAELELGKWFIAWFMFFSRTAIPKNPFMASTRRKRRFLQLLEQYLEADSISGEIPRSGRELILRCADRATDVADKEEVQLENEKRRGPKRRRVTSLANSPPRGVSAYTFSQPNSSPPEQATLEKSHCQPRSCPPRNHYSNLLQAPQSAELSGTLLANGSGQPPTLSYNASNFMSVQENCIKMGKMPVKDLDFGCFDFGDADLDALNFNRNPDSWEEDLRIGFS